MISRKHLKNNWYFI